MTILTFDVLDVSATETYGADLSPFVINDLKTPIGQLEQESGLVFAIRAAWDERVKLDNGEDLRRIAGNLFLSSQRDPASGDAAGIGNLSFWKADEFRPQDSYAVDIAVPASQYSKIYSGVTSGRFPRKAIVQVRGLEAPDEFSSLWKTESGWHLPVSSVEFSFPLGVPLVAFGASVNSELVLYSPNSVAQLQYFKSIEERCQEISNRLKWAVGTLAAVGLSLLFFR